MSSSDPNHHKGLVPETSHSTSENIQVLTLSPLSFLQTKGCICMKIRFQQTHYESWPICFLTTILYADFSLSIPSILHLISLDSFHIRIWQEGSLYAKSYNAVKHSALRLLLLLCRFSGSVLSHAPYRDYEGPTAMPWSQWILIRDLRIEISFSLVHLEGSFPLRSGFITGQKHETRILFYFSASKAVKSTATPETSPLHCRLS